MRGSITKITPIDNDTILVSCGRCVVCKESAELRISRKGFQRWQTDTHIQDAFPELGKDEREMLMTGIHPACYEQIFSEEGE